MRRRTGRVQIGHGVASESAPFGYQTRSPLPGSLIARSDLVGGVNNIALSCIQNTGWNVGGRLLNDDGRRRSFEQIASRGLRLRSRRSRNRLSSLNGRAEHIRPSLEAESISSAKPRRTTVALVGSVYWGSSSRSTELTAGDGTRFGPTLARMRACGSRESRLRARGGENSPAGLRARVSAGCPNGMAGLFLPHRAGHRPDRGPRLCRIWAATPTLANRVAWLFRWKRSTTQPGGDKTGGHMSDPYLDAIQEQWPKIRGLYSVYESKRPIILYDLQEQKIYAYPYKEFRAELSKKSQDSLKRDYEFASAHGSMIVFVRDNIQRKLVSYLMNTDSVSVH